MTVIDTAPLNSVRPPVPTTVRLSGEIDLFTSPALRQRLWNTLSHSNGLLVLDLSQVTFCDAGGLAVLIGTQSRAKARGITVALTGLRPFMTRLLRISGLTYRFPIVP
ncbi:STAS domain-containing protein [Nonomuraea sp. SBT364]|uniref:STAS domain-containing protein n=1 Tax=Nonomuraea sp. SBT364 TaxID=1580530 RepID=UPI00066E0F84|nr:STAS domain-containing protein [Nonomuraea sp. SBT364]